MDYRKFDARLSEALTETPSKARYDVLIELAPTAAPGEVERLEQLGVRRHGSGESVVTARVSARDLDSLSELPAVRQIRLKRRLRPR